jgi:hypothetical protein
LPWNGTGTFNRVYSWVADAAAGISIQPPRIDADTNDIASNGFGNALTCDGQGIATANLPMGGFRHSNVGAAVALTDYIQLQQVGIGKINWAVATGSADAEAVTYSPVLPLRDGSLFYFRAVGTNATASSQVAVNGGTLTYLTKSLNHILPGDIISGGEVAIRYNSNNVLFSVLNPQAANVVVTRVGVDFSVTSSTTLTNVTGLSVQIASGSPSTFYFEAYLTCTDAAAGGVKAGIGGTVVPSLIIYDGYVIDTNTIKGQANSTALAGAVASSTTSATSGLVIIIKGTIVVATTGTLTVQFAQKTSNGTSSVVKRGSVFVVRQVT